jgi:hypothetical protein
MNYLLLIYGEEAESWSPDPDAAQAMSDAYSVFTERIAKSGVLRAGDALESVAMATTVRVRGGEVVVTDGPFAETKEQLGGYYLVECDDLDAAIEIAAGIPGAVHGSIEIRPIRSLS